MQVYDACIKLLDFKFGSDIDIILLLLNVMKICINAMHNM